MKTANVGASVAMPRMAGALRHHGPISGVAACGSYVATAGYDNQLILWDGRTRTALSRALHDHLVNHCAFNSDGTLVVSASSDYSARIWETPDLRLKAALVGHTDDVDMAVFSPDDSRVATCALDRTVRVFDVEGRCLAELHGHSGNILCVAWSADGSRLVSSSVDGTVREWEVHAGRQLRCHVLDVRTDTVEIHSDGRIFAGDDRGRIVIIAGDVLTATQAHEAGIKKIVLDEASGTLVTLSYDRDVAVWNLPAGGQPREVSRSTFPPEVWARSGAITRDNLLAVGTFGSTYALYDWRGDRWDMEGVFAGAGLNSVAVADGQIHAVGDAGVVLGDGEVIASLGSLCNFVVGWSSMLLAGGQLGQLFDARTGKVLHQHRSPLNCAAAFVRDGVPHLAVGTYTGEALFFRMTGDGAVELAATRQVFSNAIKGIAVNAGTIFSVCASTAVAWHRIDDLGLLRRVPNAHERIANACCAAGSHGFASVGRDRKLRLWNADGTEVYLTPHPKSVKCIAASADHRTLMTGSYAGTLAAFDMDTRAWRSFSRPTAAGISSLAYDPKRGGFLASSYDGNVYFAA